MSAKRHAHITDAIIKIHICNTDTGRSSLLSIKMDKSAVHLASLLERDNILENLKEKREYATAAERSALSNAMLSLCRCQLSVGVELKGWM